VSHAVVIVLNVGLPPLHLRSQGRDGHILKQGSHSKIGYQFSNKNSTEDVDKQVHKLIEHHISAWHT